jgi:adenylate cyclase class IV
MKNGKRTRDKEINTQENAINWIRFVGDEVKNICAFLKLEEKISGNLTDLKNGKESIFELCSSLKLVMENID